MKHLNRIIIAGFLILSAGGYVALCAHVNTEHILPETYVNDVDISNMTFDEAADILKNDNISRRENAEFTISFDEQHYTVSAKDALALDYEATARSALKESSSFFGTRGFAWLKSVLAGNHIDHPSATVDSEALEAAISAGGLPSSDESVRLPYNIKDDCLTLTSGGMITRIDEKKLEDKIVDAFQSKNYTDIIDCPLKDDSTATLDQIYQAVHKDAKNATLDPDNNYAIVDEVIGIDFDKEAGELALNDAIEGEDASVDLIYTTPEVTAQDLRNRLFVDNLSTYMTKVSGSSNRLTNVKLAAEKCNGIILPSGYEFSFNKAVGEQTAARGFKPAGATLNGKPVQAYGGGICQVTSTIFAAALFANLDIEERWCHDYVSSYIAAGLDAAVAWNELDFRIVNPFPYPIMIDTIYKDGYLTVTIRGTKTDDSFVSVSTEELDSSSAHTLDVVTYRKVYTEDKSQVFVEEITRSSYAK